jgi:hypothetical protein
LRRFPAVIDESDAAVDLQAVDRRNREGGELLSPGRREQVGAAP